VRTYFRLPAFVALVLLFSGSAPVLTEDEKLQRLLKEFAAGYEQLGIPARTLSYTENLQRIQQPAHLDKQAIFFRKQTRLAKSLQVKQLSGANQLLCQQWHYELELNANRVVLEQRFRATQPTITDKGVLYQSLGKAWYLYFLKEYLSLTTSPEELKAFGMREVQKVKEEMKLVQQKLGFTNDSAAFHQYLLSRKFASTNEEELLKKYEQKYRTVLQHLPELFTDMAVPALAFAKIPNADEHSPPGFYSRENQTFYFNFYGQRHNLRALDFLLLHEGIPGHHYQSSLAAKSSAVNPLSELVWYMTYSEGWAAYCEELGKELGLYQTPEEYYGKLEWDLVRSARVVMDVGLNYNGWTREQALAFWKRHIPNQDDIAQREISRMLRWPVQALSYKVGADAILKLREKAQMEQGNSFGLRQFHNWLLSQGPMPFEVIQEAAGTMLTSKTAP
jgi:uncharacterized protein (DUF885 family)